MQLSAGKSTLSFDALVGSELIVELLEEGLTEGVRGDIVSECVCLCVNVSEC